MHDVSLPILFALKKIPDQGFRSGIDFVQLNQDPQAVSLCVIRSKQATLKLALQSGCMPRHLTASVAGPLVFHCVAHAWTSCC